MKECNKCGRSLDSIMFTKSSSYEDNLSPNCRTCKSWKGSKMHLTVELVESFELQAFTALAQAAQLMAESLLLDEWTVEDIVANRTLYENFAAKTWEEHDLSQDWKLPIWINPHTLLN